MEFLKDLDLSQITQRVVEYGSLYLPRLFLALVTLLVGMWIIKVLNQLLLKAMHFRKFDESLERFLASLISIVLRLVLFISVASMIGVEMTSFIAIMGAAGLAVGLALQGSMSNLAGGVLIMFFKPFKIGDFIEASGFMGTVSDIQIFYTYLKTPDNRVIIIPNGDLSNGNVINYSMENTRRVDMTFGVSYQDDIKKTRDILQSLIDQDSRILKDPLPQIRLAALADSSVNFAVRVWCNTADYWDIFFEMTEKVKINFDKEGISIPFPQRDIHLYNHDQSEME